MPNWLNDWYVSNKGDPLSLVANMISIVAHLKLSCIHVHCGIQICICLKCHLFENVLSQFQLVRLDGHVHEGTKSVDIAKDASATHFRNQFKCSSEMLMRATV